MIAHECFIDSNILVYAHDAKERIKHPVAARLVHSFWDAAPLLPFISIQVLQEFYVTLTRKGISDKEACLTIEDFMQWNVIDNDSHVLKEGLHLKSKFNISLWDALIIAAAVKAKVKYLITEDLNANQTYEGIRIINPFMNKS